MRIRESLPTPFQPAEAAIQQKAEKETRRNNDNAMELM